MTGVSRRTFVSSLALACTAGASVAQIGADDEDEAAECELDDLNEEQLEDLIRERNQRRLDRLSEPCCPDPDNETEDH